MDRFGVAVLITGKTMGLGGERGVAGEFHPVTIGFELQLIPGWLLTVYRFPLYLFQTGLSIPFLKSQLLHVACKGHTGLLPTGGCPGQFFPVGFLILSSFVVTSLMGAYTKAWGSICFLNRCPVISCFLIDLALLGLSSLRVPNKIMASPFSLIFSVMNRVVGLIFDVQYTT